MLKQCCVYDLGRSKIPKKLCYRSTEIKLVFWALFYSGLEPLVVAVSGYLLLELADGRHERNASSSVIPLYPFPSSSAITMQGPTIITVSRYIHVDAWCAFTFNVDGFWSAKFFCSALPKSAKKSSKLNSTPNTFVMCKNSYYFHIVRLIFRKIDKNGIFDFANNN